MSDLANRFHAAIAGIVEELLPNRRLAYPRRYRISKANGDGKFSARPENDKSGLPVITDAPIRAIAGGNAGSKLKNGTSVLVCFAECNPADPFLAWIDESEAPDELVLTAQTKIKLNAPSVELNGAAVGVARVGDTVVTSCPAGAGTGTIQGGSSNVKAGA